MSWWQNMLDSCDSRRPGAVYQILAIVLGPPDDDVYQILAWLMIRWYLFTVNIHHSQNRNQGQIFLKSKFFSARATYIFDSQTYKLCNWVQNNTHCISFHFYGDSKKKVSWIQKEKWENDKKIKFSTHVHDSGLLHWRGPFGVIWLINHPAPQWQIDNCPVIYEWDPLSPEVRTKVFCPCFSTFSKHF